MEKRINSISLLRIISMGMIVMVHFGQSLPLPNLFHKIVVYGQEGVTFFFITSGYVIAMSLDRDNDTKRFYIKRLFRIVPIYYVVVICNAIAGFIIGTYPRDITGLSWLRYFTFIQAIVPSDNSFYWNNCAALWTMSAFALFYIIAPFMHRAIKNSHSKQMGFLWGGILLSIVSNYLYSSISLTNFEPSCVYLSTHSPFAVLFEFLVGMYLYYNSDDQVKVINILAIGILGSIFGVDRFVIVGLFGASFYCLLRISIRCNEKISTAILKLDEYSFSVYLGHTTIMYIMSRVQEVRGFSNFYLAVIDFFGSLVFIVILHNIIEKPFSNIGKKCCYNIPMKRGD